MPRRILILHADDLGMNTAVDAGILQGFSQGLLTSTSILANGPHAIAALEDWRNLCQQEGSQSSSAAVRRKLHDPGTPFDLGVHLNLTQGRPLTGERYPPALLDARGRFPGIGQVFRKLRTPRHPYGEAVRAELAAQVEFVLAEFDAITHLNGHQYIETLPGVAQFIPGLLQRYDIPAARIACEPALTRTLLWPRPQLMTWGLGMIKGWYARRFAALISGTSALAPDTYFGASHAGRISLAVVQQYLRHAPRTGVVEIAWHPGMRPDLASSPSNDDGWHDPLASARPDELQVLTGTDLPDLLERGGWSLGRFRDCRVSR